MLSICSILHHAKTNFYMEIKKITKIKLRYFSKKESKYQVKT